MSYLFVMYDRFAGTDSNLMEFETKQLGVALVRQQVRDAFIRGDISEDYLCGNSLLYIGEHLKDTQELGQEEPIQQWILEEFAYDLIEDRKVEEFHDVRRGAHADNDEPRTSDSGEPSDSVLRV